jgi:hypothetical protein
LQQEPRRSRWITLVEALGHIQATAKCSSVSAQVQLKQEIGAGVIPVKWANARGPRDAPAIHDLARSQLVLSEPGMVLNAGALRVLLLLRHAVCSSTWPRPKGTTVKVFETVKTSQPSSSEKDSARWMTLVEAIEHICILEDCDSMEALRQFKEEIADGMVPVRWTDSEGPNDNPDHKRLSDSQLLLIGFGVAPDVDDEETFYRPLLVERSAVKRLWQLPGNDFEMPASEPPGKKATSRPESVKLKRPPADEEEIRVAVRKVYDEAREASREPPNIEQAWQLIPRKLNARRKIVRKILHEPQFANLRRNAGKQS